MGEGGTDVSAVPAGEGGVVTVGGGVEQRQTEAREERRIFRYSRLSLSGRLAARAQADIHGGVAQAISHKAVKRPASQEAASSKRPHGGFFVCLNLNFTWVLWINIYIILLI